MRGIRINCLVADTPLYEQVRDLTEVIGWSMVEEGKKLPVRKLFNKIRKEGIEIDLETVGEIYNSVFPATAEFMAPEEVDADVLKSTNDAIQRMAKTEDSTELRQIRIDSPTRYLAIRLANMFTDTQVLTQEVRSDMVTIQNAVWKGLQRYLDKDTSKQQPKTKKDWETVLQEAFELNEYGYTTAEGELKGIATVWNELHTDIEAMARELEEQERPDRAEALRTMAERFAAATFTISLSKGEAWQVLRGAAVAAGYGHTTATGQHVIDFERLSRANADTTSLRDNIAQVINSMGYTGQAESDIITALENEFYDLMGEAINRQMSSPDAMAKKAVKNILNDFGLQAAIGVKTVDSVVVTDTGERVPVTTSKPRTVSEWIKEESITNLSELRDKARAALSAAAYRPLLMQQAIAEMEKYFNHHFGTLAKREAREYVNNMIGDNRTPLEFLKANGFTYADQLFGTTADALFERQDIPEDVKQLIVAGMVDILRLQERADSELASMSRALTAQRPGRKSDIVRLARLYNLGVFDDAYQALLYNFVGAQSLTREQSTALMQLAGSVSELVAVMDKDYGQQFYANRLHQTLQRKINTIIADANKDRSTLYKVVSVIGSVLEVTLSGLLMAPFTISENVYSGLKEIVVPSLVGGSATREKAAYAWKLYWAMFKDAATSGQAYGEEIGSFAPNELYLNTLKWSNPIKRVQEGDIKSALESVLFAVTFVGRVGLLAFDSANKAVITNSIFTQMIRQALMENPGGTPRTRQEADQIISEALYGQNLEAAKAEARLFIDRVNAKLPPEQQIRKTEAYVLTLANDIVKAALEQQTYLDSDVIEALYKSSYHVAGYAIGHEPNNWWSTAVRGIRDKRRAGEERLIRDGLYDDAAVYKMNTALLNYVILRFTGGATNWMYLRFQALGWGFLTAGASALAPNGKFGRKLPARTDRPADDIRLIRHTAEERYRLRGHLGRASLSFLTSMILYGIGYTIFGSPFGGGDDDDDEKANQRLVEVGELSKVTPANRMNGRTAYARVLDENGDTEVRAIRESDMSTTDKDKALIKLFQDRKLAYQQEIKELTSQSWGLFDLANTDTYTKNVARRFMPDGMLLHYFINTEGSSFLGAMAYAEKTMGIASDFSDEARIAEATRLYIRGEEDKAMGAIGQVVGDRINMPLWRSYKSWYNTAVWATGGEPKKSYQTPADFMEGIAGNGFIEDMGWYRRNSPLTIIKGIGAASATKFQELGYTRMDDLPPDMSWLDAKDSEGKDILTSNNKASAKVSYQSWIEMNR